jgi:threonine/homoserine/homoserine lactone efflux protein
VLPPGGRRSPCSRCENVQDLRRTAGFDGLDGIEDGSPPVLNELAALLVFAFVGSFSPGPNNAVLWASGISFGFRRTIRHVVGGALGVSALVVGVAAGIGALLEAVPEAALALRIGGSVYLLWVAYRVAGSGDVSRAESAHPLGVWQAAVFQWLNPKAWVFAIAVVGTFLPEDVPRPVGIALLAGVVLAVVTVSFTIWAAGGAARARFVEDERRRRLVSLILAALIVASVLFLWI